MVHCIVVVSLKLNSFPESALALFLTVGGGVFCRGVEVLRELLGHCV